MFFKILQIIKLILGCILEAEFNFADASGAEKRSGVMKVASAELRRQGIMTDGAEETAGNVLEHLGKIVDGAVGVFNTTGVFKHTASSSTPPATKPEPEPTEE